jgi:uncharacterized membrane protein
MSLSPLLTAPFAVQIHAFSALAALVIGALVLFRRKGTPLHRLMGRTWVGLMLVTATSSWFINDIRMIGPFSPIHLFALITYVGVMRGILAARRGDIATHRVEMQSLYFFALILAGCFTLLPGRRMAQVLFGPDAGWTPSLIVIGLGLGLSALIYKRLQAGTQRPST